MSTLAIQNLHKSFTINNQEKKVLDGINLTLADNEFVSIVGTSGCGKSTMLSIAAGLEDFDSGNVLVDGIPINGAGMDRGVVFKHIHYFHGSLLWKTLSSLLRPQVESLANARKSRLNTWS